MAEIIDITSLADPRLAPFATLTEAQLRNRLHAEQGIFIAESPKVIRVALNAGYEPLALLCERKHILGDAADIIDRLATCPIYTGSRELLRTLTGYTLTRGVLCAMRRPKHKNISEVCKQARRVAVIDAVVDSTNIGAIFRSAAALGIDAVLVTSSSCDPLNRRAVRVSMGSVFLVPWAWVETPSADASPSSTQEANSQIADDHYINILHSLGFKTAAMALEERSISLSDPSLKAEQQLAIILGNEGDGLPSSTIQRSDYVVRIPMSHAVDSLNVAAASAVAFWELGKH
ncbi:MAG: RNA methyltransferase [Bacteroidaceae bacterium]|nr:RNA methyltransferase [Bacteroidaceae bacterium]